jgi:hypothetical protein
MPSFTPKDCRSEYRLYDNKDSLDMQGVRDAIEGAGRTNARVQRNVPAAPNGGRPGALRATA